jgi:hypothetical protein
MHPIYAAALTIGVILIIALPIMYFIFRSEKINNELPNCFERVPMLIEEIEEIEDALSLKIPEDLRNFLATGGDHLPDTEMVMDSHKNIIMATNDYRSGIYGLPPFPDNYLYLGDSADACPFVCDCNNGEIIQLKKGNISKPCLRRFNSFSEFKAAM